MASMPDALRWLQATTNLNYFLSLYQKQQASGEALEMPAEVAQIAALMLKLPVADQREWNALGKGKVLKKALKRVDQRSKWTEEKKGELLRLVEDEDYRNDTIGTQGTRAGKVNWAALARHLGFATPATVHKQYNSLKGIEETPKPKRAAEEEEEGGAAKKAMPAAPAPVVAAAAAPAAGDGWTAQQEQELVKLIEDKKFRKQTLGKSKLKYKRIGKHFDKDKKECKKKYKKLTHKEPPEEEDDE